MVECKTLTLTGDTSTDVTVGGQIGNRCCGAIDIYTNGILRGTATYGSGNKTFTMTKGGTVKYVARPDSGYHFVDFGTTDGSKTSNPLEITNLQKNFQADAYFDPGTSTGAYIADFYVSSPVVNGGTITIDARCANNGNVSANINVNLKSDNIELDYKPVTVPANTPPTAGVLVRFTKTAGNIGFGVGTHNVCCYIAGQTDKCKSLTVNSSTQTFNFTPVLIVAVVLLGAGAYYIYKKDKNETKILEQSNHKENNYQNTNEENNNDQNR